MRKYIIESDSDSDIDSDIDNGSGNDSDSVSDDQEDADPNSQLTNEELEEIEAEIYSESDKEKLSDANASENGQEDTDGEYSEGTNYEIARGLFADLNKQAAKKAILVPDDENGGPAGRAKKSRLTLLKLQNMFYTALFNLKCVKNPEQFNQGAFLEQQKNINRSLYVTKLTAMLEKKKEKPIDQARLNKLLEKLILAPVLFHGGIAADITATIAAQRILDACTAVAYEFLQTKVDLYKSTKRPRPRNINQLAKELDMCITGNKQSRVMLTALWDTSEATWGKSPKRRKSTDENPRSPKRPFIDTPAKPEEAGMAAGNGADKTPVAPSQDGSPGPYTREWSQRLPSSSEDENANVQSSAPNETEAVFGIIQPPSPVSDITHLLGNAGDSGELEGKKNSIKQQIERLKTQEKKCNKRREKMKNILSAIQDNEATKKRIEEALAIENTQLNLLKPKVEECDEVDKEGKLAKELKDLNAQLSKVNLDITNHNKAVRAAEAFLQKNKVIPESQDSQ